MFKTYWPEQLTKGRAPAAPAAPSKAEAAAAAAAEAAMAPAGGERTHAATMRDALDAAAAPSNGRRYQPRRSHAWELRADLDACAGAPPAMSDDGKGLLARPETYADLVEKTVSSKGTYKPFCEEARTRFLADPSQENLQALMWALEKPVRDLKTGTGKTKLVAAELDPGFAVGKTNWFEHPWGKPGLFKHCKGFLEPRPKWVEPKKGSGGAWTAPK